jgi:hypothetical protein
MEQDSAALSLDLPRHAEAYCLLIHGFSQLKGEAPWHCLEQRSSALSRMERYEQDGS